MIDTVLVTAFVRQRINSQTDHGLSVAKYLEQFAKIAATGLPIILLLDRSLLDQVSYPNVTVIPTTLGELDTYKAAHGLPLDLPDAPTETHLRPDLLLIINAKAEFVRLALDRIGPTRCVAWIDFGMFKFIADTALAQRRLQTLPVTEGRVTIPGIHPQTNSSLDWIDWRFCGSIYWGDPASMRHFSEVWERLYRETLPKLTWEINLWAKLEEDGVIDPVWYASNHDDTILAYPGAPDHPGG